MSRLAAALPSIPIFASSLTVHSWQNAGVDVNDLSTANC